MAAENEIQFFEAPFQYQIGEFKSNVNLTYHKLVNTRPIKMPQINTGFETLFTQSYNEKGDKSYFGIKKREGFQKCKNLDEIVWMGLGGEYDYIVTDHQILNGERFLMVCDVNFEKMCILHSPVGRYLDCNPTPQDIWDCSWDIKGWKVRKQEWNTVWKTTPCSYHKFQKIITLQSKDPSKSDLGSLYIGTVTYEGGSTTSVLFNDNRSVIEGIILGKFIQPYDSDDDDIVVGQALQVGDFDSKQGWYNMGYGSWAGVTDKFHKDIFDEDGNKIGVLNYQGPVTCYMYDEAKLGIAFAGIRQITSGEDRNGIREWDGNRFIFQTQTNLLHANITSLTEDLDGLVYTTDRGTLNFMRPHSNAGQSLGGTIYSTHTMYGGWDLAKACGDYVFLFGPESTGIAYKNGTDERGDYRWNIQILDRNLGYWSKDSVLVFNEELYMIDNKKRFVKLDLEATTDSYYRAHFKLTATDMSLHWINTDLRNLDKERGDRAILCKEGTRIYIIINDCYDAYDENDGELNTKILVYEDELKYRHRWYLCGIDIRGIHGGTWFGRGTYKNQGTYDCKDWHIVSGKIVDYDIPFKEIISMTFGDTSWFTWKEVLWIKMAIGYHSKITANTTFTLRTDGGGYTQTLKLNTLWKTSYIKAITELEGSGMTDENYKQMLFKSMPIGIGMYSGNGVGLQKDIYRNMNAEFEQYCNYSNPIFYDESKCCDPKPASQPEGNGCTMKAPSPRKENLGSDRLQYHFNIAKYGTLIFKAGQQGQNFYLELMAEEYDEIEFLGFMIGRMFMDNNFDNITNTIIYESTRKNSLPGTMGK